MACRCTFGYYCYTWEIALIVRSFLISFHLSFKIVMLFPRSIALIMAEKLGIGCLGVGSNINLASFFNTIEWTVRTLPCDQCHISRYSNGL